MHSAPSTTCFLMGMFPFLANSLSVTGTIVSAAYSCTAQGRLSFGSGLLRPAHLTLHTLTRNHLNIIYSLNVVSIPVRCPPSLAVLVAVLSDNYAKLRICAGRLRPPLVTRQERRSEAFQRHSLNKRPKNLCKKFFFVFLVKIYLNSQINAASVDRTLLYY